MEDPTRDIDNRLLTAEASPTTIVQALERIDGLIHDTRESHALTTPLVARLQYLRSELKNSSVLATDTANRFKLVTRFASTISEALRFLRKFSRKKAIQRIAASRLVREGVRRLHSMIDIMFQDAGLGDAPEMTEWREHEAAGIQEQLERLREIVTASGAIVRDLSAADVEEALLEIRLELERRNNPPEFVELLTNASNHRDVTALERVATSQLPEATATTTDALQHPDITATEGVVRRELEPWFVRRDTVDMAETPFDMGSFGNVYEAKRGAEGADVCVKLLLVDSPDAQAQFLREAKIWHKLKHPNVIKMLGGCHVGSPLFFISEFAKAGNFVDYLYKIENKNKLWRLFLEAAQGLSYLHSERVIHADIKCCNLLVGDDGQAKLCDFGFSHIKTLSIGKSLKAQPSSTRWKAPECIFYQGPAANPTRESDVYSLGMSIIEAKTGDVPWGVASEDDIIAALVDGKGYPRPDGVFTNREWELVQGMTEFDPAKRWPLNRAIEVLRELADGAALVSEVQQKLEDLAVAALSAQVGSVACPTCQEPNPVKNKFCGECSAKLA